MSIERYLVDEDEDEARPRPQVMPSLTLDEWLDGMMAEREVVIMRLRQIDRVLVKHGRIKGETIPRRER